MESEEESEEAPPDALPTNPGPARPLWYTSLPQQKPLFKRACKLFVISSPPPQEMLSEAYETATDILGDGNIGASQALEEVFSDIKRFRPLASVPWMDELLAPVQASLTTTGSSRLLLEFDLEACIKKLRITRPRPPEVKREIWFGGWFRPEQPSAIEADSSTIINRLLTIYSSAQTLHTFPTANDSKRSRLKLDALVMGVNGIAWFGVPSAWMSEDSQQWESITLLPPEDYAQLLDRYKGVWADKDNNYLLCNPLFEELSKYAPLFWKIRTSRDIIVAIQKMDSYKSLKNEEVQQMLATPTMLFQFHAARYDYITQYEALLESYRRMEGESQATAWRKIVGEVRREIGNLKSTKVRLGETATILLLIFTTRRTEGEVIPGEPGITQTLRTLIDQAGERVTPRNDPVPDIHRGIENLRSFKEYVEAWPNPEVLRFSNFNLIRFLYRKFYNDAKIDIDQERDRRNNIGLLKLALTRELGNVRRSVGRAKHGSRPELQKTEKLSQVVRKALRALPPEERQSALGELRRRQKLDAAKLEKSLGPVGDTVIERRGFRRAEMRALDRKAVILAPPPPPPEESKEATQDEQDRLEDAVLKWSLDKGGRWREEFAECPPAWASDRRWEEWKYRRMKTRRDAELLQNVPRYPSTSQPWFDRMPPSPATDEEWKRWLTTTRETARSIRQTVPLARRTLSLLYHDWCDSPTDCQALEENQRALSQLLASEEFHVDVIVTQGHKSHSDALGGREKATMITGNDRLSFHWKLRDPALELLKVERQSDRHVGIFRKGDAIFTLIHLAPLSSPESQAENYSADAVLGSYSADAVEALTHSLYASGFEWVKHRARPSTMAATQVRASYVDFLSARPGTILGPVRTAMAAEGTRSPMYARLTKTYRANIPAQLTAPPEQLREIEIADPNLIPADFEDVGDDDERRWWDPNYTWDSSSDESSSSDSNESSSSDSDESSSSDEEFKELKKTLKKRGLIQGSRRHIPERKRGMRANRPRQPGALPVSE